MTWPIGISDSPATNWNPVRETSHWTGKPWRRLELLTQRTFYKGEQVDVGRDLTLHFGLRRIGLAFTLSIAKQSVLDYSEETT